MSGTDTPYPNGIAFRVGELERRANRMESGDPGTITGDIRDDIRELKEKVTNLTRSVWVLIGTLFAFMGVLFQLFGGG
jgi:phosphoserine phosphatase